jgi:3-oxoacyl-[acyl-carrier protein] reductase
MRSDLEDLTVLITGASGGIGRSLADAFADEGCNLVLHAGRRLDPLEAYAASRPWAERSVRAASDLAEPEALDELVGAGVDRFGRLDVCVVNAGIWPADSRAIWEMEPDRMRRVIEVNLLGAMWTIRSFLSSLAARGARADGRGASICLIGSTAGRFGEAGHHEYATSKAAFHGLMLSVKNEIVELDPYARINLVEPGWTVTPMAAAALQEPGMIEGTVRTMPLRQLARPEDIARAVLYLSSPALARHVSGEVITVAGGMEGRVQWERDQVDADEVRDRLTRE